MSLFTTLVPAMGYSVADYTDNRKFDGSITKSPHFFRNLAINLAGNKDLVKIVTGFLKFEDSDTNNYIIKIICVSISLTGIYLVLREQEIKDAEVAALIFNLINIIRVM